MSDQALLPDFAELLSRCQKDIGDERAWGRLVKHFDPSLLMWSRAYLRKYGQTRQLDEDALEIREEVWIRLVQHEGKGIRSFGGDEEEAFRAFLARTALNATRDLVRRKSAKKRPQIADLDEETRDHAVSSYADGTADPAEALELEDLRDRLFATLRTHWESQSRTPVHRNLVVCQLSWLHGQSANAIASILSLGLSRGGVEKVIDKAKRHLREEFGEDVLER